MANPQVFELFPILPREIRDSIWKFALPSARIVQLSPPEEEDDDWDEDLELYKWEVEYLENLYGTLLVKSMRRSPETVWPYEIPMMNDSELRRLKDQIGTESYQEDTRSIPEKDLHLLCHILGRGPNASLKRQTQLNNYGFTSLRAAPTLGHVLEYDMTWYAHLDGSMPEHVLRRREFQILGHIVERLDPEGLFQPQLFMYDFTTSAQNASSDYPAVKIAECTWKSSVSCADRRFPVIMRVCSESRAVAVREGYALSFASWRFPARTWFNPYTDYVDIWPRTDCFFSYEMLCEDLKSARKVIIDAYDLWPDLEYIAQTFKNVEEVVVAPHREEKLNRPRYIEDLRIVDATDADILYGFPIGPKHSCKSMRHLLGIGYDSAVEMLAQDHNKTFSSGLSFFKISAYKLEKYLIERLHERWPELDDIPLKAPLVRFGFMTCAKGEEMLHEIRRERGTERELLLPPNFAEEMDTTKILHIFRKAFYHEPNITEGGLVEEFD